MSIFDDALGILGKVAPTLATMVGGPFAGAAVSAIEAALGLPTTGDKDAALRAVANATPDQLLALKAEDNRHAEAMEKLGLDRETIAAQDRDSARKMQIETRSRIPGALAVVFVVGFFAAQALVFTHAIPEGSETLAARVLGTLDAALMLILAYYYGSSAGSARKDQLLAQAPPTNK